MAVGAGLAAASALRSAAPAAGFRALNAEELATVAALALVLFPGAPFPLNGVQADVPAQVDAMVADLPAVHRSGFRLALRALEWGTFASRGQRFSTMAPRDATQVVTAWSDPAVVPRRVAADAVKMVLGTAYFAHPAITAHIGWRASCSGVKA